MGEVRVGITAWTEKTLIEESDFYPPDVKTPEERLRFYATRFPVVEVDSTFYGLPSERNSGLWVDRTPGSFDFHVKAFALLTGHPTAPRNLPKDLRESLPQDLQSKRNLYPKDLPVEVRDQVWERFREALMPLHSAGKLAAVLFQFPPWFVISRRSKQEILAAKERLPDYRLAVEFRHGTWMEKRNQEETLSFLSEHGLTYVCVDMPQGFDSSLPPVAAATTDDLAVVRFHGRNEEVWLKKTKTAAERFEYLYDRRQLKSWVPKIESLQEQAKETHALFNNCYRDYATTNARQLASLLE
ncbi:MAG: DUF72 domain-containing protein [Actinobacteria bacterium]|nr:DUF72 domain-containing protein [Actinomycetota bacterium]